MDLHEMETTCFKLECGVNNIDAIRTAMEKGDFNADQYNGALYFTYMCLSDLVEELNMLIEKAFEERRNSK